MVILSRKQTFNVATWLEFVWLSFDSHVDICVGCSYFWNSVMAECSLNYIR